MMSDDESAQLIHRWKSGDERAAEEIFVRYVSRLVALARKRIGPQLQRRIDPEDVIQSAYRSFFRKAEADEFKRLSKSGDMWKLLAAITINKLRSQFEFHGAAKRSVTEEDSVSEYSTVIRVSPVGISREPAPDEAAAIVDEVESVMSELDSLSRQIFELRLTGLESDEIAPKIYRSPRTVRRTLAAIRADLTKRLARTLED